MKDGKDRDIATEIAGTARDTSTPLYELRSKYIGTYDVQRDLIEAVKEGRGSLASAVPIMQEKLPIRDQLSSDGAALREGVLNNDRKLDEKYAAFKGVAGVTEDFQPPVYEKVH